jgi:hypothetical protein
MVATLKRITYTLCYDSEGEKMKRILLFLFLLTSLFANAREASQFLSSKNND